MAPHEPPAGQRDPNRPQGDPWNAFGYLVSGVLLYGLIGWGLDRWLGTSFLVAIGIIAGAALGTYQTYKRFQIPDNEPRDDGKQ
jgi:ATP synthase protein I